MIVNNSKSLKLILLIFAVKIAEQCTILLGVGWMQNPWSLFYNLSLFFLIGFQFGSNPEATCRNFPSAHSSISEYQTIVNPSIEIIPPAAA